MTPHAYVHCLRRSQVKAANIPGTLPRGLERTGASLQHTAAEHGSTEKESVQRFSSEITELRALGFAEGLPIEVTERPRGIVVRLESGRVGVAVEFCADGTPQYAVKPLVRDVGNRSGMATDIWSRIVREIRRRAPLSDDK